ncbi:Hypothetical predicted protein, partial [Pelobates cultripes]
MATLSITEARGNRPHDGPQLEMNTASPWSRTAVAAVQLILGHYKVYRNEGAWDQGQTLKCGTVPDDPGHVDTL